MIIGDTPKYVRVSYLDADTNMRKFTGMVRRQGVRLRGERREADPKDPDGTILHVFFAHVDDVVCVERQNPVYETWEVTTWQ